MSNSYAQSRSQYTWETYWGGFVCTARIRQHWRNDLVIGIVPKAYSFNPKTHQGWKEWSSSSHASRQGERWAPPLIYPCCVSPNSHSIKNRFQFFLGYIDLSKRRVSAEDVIKCEERYNKSKTVHTIMRHVAEKTGADMEQINDLVAWPLYKKYGHAYDAFKLSITYVSSSEIGRKLSDELNVAFLRV